MSVPDIMQQARRPIADLPSSSASPPPPPPRSGIDFVSTGHCVARATIRYGSTGHGVARA
eukprot:3941344-Rhodomonas_salina.4